jgi:hypothetical protein
MAITLTVSTSKPAPVATPVTTAETGTITTAVAPAVTRMDVSVSRVEARVETGVAVDGISVAIARATVEALLTRADGDVEPVSAERDTVEAGLSVAESAPIYELIVGLGRLAPRDEQTTHSNHSDQQQLVHGSLLCVFALSKTFESPTGLTVTLKE